MKTTIIIIAALLLSACGKETPEESMRNKRLYLVTNVQMALESSLRDPGSVKYERKAVRIADSIVCMKYRAKNGFGGYGVGYLVTAPSGVSQKASDFAKYCNGSDSEYDVY